MTDVTGKEEKNFVVLRKNICSKHESTSTHLKSTEIENPSLMSLKSHWTMQCQGSTWRKLESPKLAKDILHTVSALTNGHVTDIVREGFLIPRTSRGGGWNHVQDIIHQSLFRQWTIHFAVWRKHTQETWVSQALQVLDVLFGLLCAIMNWSNWHSLSASSTKTENIHDFCCKIISILMGNSLLTSLS